jgi:hypothetical protein
MFIFITKIRGFVVTKFVKPSDEFDTKQGEHEFHGVVDHFLDKKRDGNTKFDTNLTVQSVCT